MDGGFVTTDLVILIRKYNCIFYRIDSLNWV